MAKLPITHVTLYKHGVGYFERRGAFSGSELTLAFPEEAMNDILKSLTAIDRGAGQVLGVDYATPQTREERLAGNSIRLEDTRSLRDLLVCLRGRQTTLHLDQGENWQGVLVGIDEPPEEQALEQTLVSLLAIDTGRVHKTTLGRVQTVDVEDEQAAADLRFFLETSLTQEQYRQLTIRLTPGEHELAVFYVGPAPTWRVSYRIVAESEGEEGSSALLLGWGIFDNQLDEDLDEVTLSLIAGMPISFIYDLYNPFTPERPVIEEEGRVAAGPVALEAASYDQRAWMAEAPPAAALAEAPVPYERRAAFKAQDVARSTVVATEAEALGELFGYHITTPVSVGRGQSAMVPILGVEVKYRKELYYNASQLPNHPVATVRFDNNTGLTLERGPVTVIEDSEYVGEALLPFTPEGQELLVPHAVELGIRVQEHNSNQRETAGVNIRGNYLLIEEWDIRERRYQLNSSLSEARTVLVEHPRQSGYDLHNTLAPSEQTDRHYRFAVEVPARGEKTLVVRARRLVSRREEVRRQSYQELERYLRQGMLRQSVYSKLRQLLGLWDQVGDAEERIETIDKERQKIFRTQEQIRGNMGALGTSGKEGALRTRYVEQLEAQEEELQGLAQEERDSRERIEQLKKEIEALLRGLG